MATRRALLLLLCAGLARPETVLWTPTPRETIEARLRRYGGTNLERKASLARLFAEAGCAPQHYQEQPVRGSKVPNVLCTLPGQTTSVIVVGAHFDRVPKGDGVADNWSGAALLPTLLESLRSQPRRHTYVFVGFTDEEAGLKGSQSYVRSLSSVQAAAIRAMVNLDTLGLNPPQIWLSRADKGLADTLAAVATSLGLPLGATNIDKVGSTDSESFRERKIPSLTVHSVTQESMAVLHTEKDEWAAMNLDAYYDTYRLLAVYLAVLDTRLE